MKFLNLILNYVKKIITINSKLTEIILQLYFRSTFYRKKHIRDDNYKWLKNVNLSLINKNEGQLIIGDLHYIIPKNNYNLIPLHQKYLYAALINYYNIPKYYILFWDALIVIHEIFFKNVYDKGIEVNMGDTILDIGASIGWYTCKIAKDVGENGRIIAVEPNPVNYYYLEKNITLNNLNNVTLLNIGVWNTRKELNLLSKGYGSSLIFHKDLKNRKELVKIKVDTIDKIVSELKIDKLDLIKMDIEGAEIEALIGARNILQDFNMLRLVIAAYHKNDKGIENYKILVPYLERMGFQIFKEYLPYIVGLKKKLN